MSNDGKPMINLDRYYSRTGYTGSSDATLETLADLVEHHIAAIPFENIDVLLGRPIDISLAAIEAKLVERRRGGYCFEQNRLLGAVLATLGFHVENLAARVLWGRHENDPPRPRTHMALRVTIDGEPWLVDVGFGGTVPVSPLRFNAIEAQPTRHEIYRIVPNGDTSTVEAHAGDIWRALYEVSGTPLLDVDYEPLNWFTSTHPASPFKAHLMVARATRDARFSLMDGRLTIRHRGGSHEQRGLHIDELETALADIFGLAVEPAWRPLLERLAISS
ncbi:arylamine N-acetyltransferase family protein [Pararobbsia alpina]|uniref:Arylamine N-acetyltransferase n=1 Tax=Pararobbsia alpina TaxID=621374 RepID=A0A6S7B6V6_9BURK|nr:arylamine N-acetyltransferase [Pararobbsia alpina]CAB3787714.1 Arylamine N-acetyltransferase [Pararobbsia alpina]